MLKSILFFVALSLIGTAHAKVARPPQYVILAFDGSKTLSFWNASLDFAKANGVTYTYFASGVYFVPDAQKNNYVEPHFGKGKSNIGFGGTTADIQARLGKMQRAHDEGHEIASHANAHFDGSSYSEAQWNLENDQFTGIMANAWNAQGVGTKQPQWWKNYFLQNLSDDPGMVGFRAPLLGVGKGLWPSLKSHGILYDTSRVDRMDYWPQQIDGIWNFPLASLTIAGTGKKTLSMDYNFYYADSKGVTGPAGEHEIYRQRMFKTYMGYFENNYYGNRAPLHIGHHFSMWNGGAYWNAMKDFIGAVCKKPEVICTNYKELLAFVEANKANIPAYKAKDFDRVVNPHGLQTQLATGGVRELSEVEKAAYEASGINHFNAHDEMEEETSDLRNGVQ